MTTNHIPDNRKKVPAVAGPVQHAVRPWGVCFDMNAQPVGFDRRAGDILRWNQPEHGPVYDQSALDAAIATERERCAEIARRWGDTHADGETVNARNAASKIARGIEGPNGQITGPQREDKP